MLLTAHGLLKNIVIFLDIHVGDLVSLNEDKAFVKSEFAKLNFNWDDLEGKPIKFIWDDFMTPMLGNPFKVLPKLIAKNHPEIIALPSPDGSQNGQWYFPKTVVKKIGK